jgi:hypothetical protein
MVVQIFMIPQEGVVLCQPSLCHVVTFLWATGDSRECFHCVGSAGARSNSGHWKRCGKMKESAGELWGKICFGFTFGARFFPVNYSFLIGSNQRSSAFRLYTFRD